MSTFGSARICKSFTQIHVASRKNLFGDNYILSFLKNKKKEIFKFFTGTCFLN